MTVVAVCQLAPVLGDLDGNRTRAAAAVEDAAAAGAHIVVLPELCSSGYAVASVDEARALAEPADGTTTTQWRALAARLGTTIIGGFCECGDGGAVHNSAALVDPDGVRAVYRKAYLWDREIGVFTRGDTRPPVIETRFGRIGVLILYDMRFPEWVRVAADAGADLIAAPTSWPAEPRPPGERPAEVVRVQAMASMHRVFVAVADRYGSERDIDWVGGSVIVAPNGFPLAGPVAAEAANEPAILLADCDLAQARDKRIGPRNDVVADRRHDLPS